MNPVDRHRQRGFTLVELLVAIAIVAMISGISLMSFRSYLQEQRLRLTAAELENHLSTARTIALKNLNNLKQLKNSGNCRVKLLSAAAATFGPDTSLNDNVCTLDNLPNLNLYLTASKDLTISDNTTYTFTKFGTLDGGTSLSTTLSSVATPWSWCIHVTGATGIIRVGTKDSRNASPTCNYRRG